MAKSRVSIHFQFETVHFSVSPFRGAEGKRREQKGDYLTLDEYQQKKRKSLAICLILLSFVITADFSVFSNNNPLTTLSLNLQSTHGCSQMKKKKMPFLGEKRKYDGGTSQNSVNSQFKSFRLGQVSKLARLSREM